MFSIPFHPPINLALAVPYMSLYW